MSKARSLMFGSEKLLRSAGHLIVPVQLEIHE
jgi:hypothetical protein